LISVDSLSLYQQSHFVTPLFAHILTSPSHVKKKASGIFQVINRFRAGSASLEWTFLHFE